MLGSSRILWGEGLFLRPQHFQQQALFQEVAIGQVLRQVHGNPWGVRRVALDSDALRGGQIRLNHLELVFRDGTQVNAPNADPLPTSRNLADIPQIGTQTVVYACLPVLNAFGGNCSADAASAARPPRYLITRETAQDLYTTALEAEITTLQANVRLLVEEENRDGHVCVAIARIVRNASGAWEQDEDFVPPLVEISGSPHVGMMARRLLDILLVKSQALAASHRERVKSVVEYGTSDIASFWLLHTVNRTFPLLNHFAVTPTHPEALYRLLAQFCGELLTFSAALTLADIPAYDHEKLTSVFDRLDSLIREFAGDGGVEPLCLDPAR